MTGQLLHPLEVMDSPALPTAIGRWRGRGLGARGSRRGGLILIVTPRRENAGSELPQVQLGATGGLLSPLPSFLML